VKETRDGEYFQGDALALHRDHCFKTIALTHVSKTSFINDDNRAHFYIALLPANQMLASCSTDKPCYSF
jgi:hypothetical protein